jgi:hypothetical protein
LPEMEAMMEALLKEEEEVWLHKCGHSYCDGGAILRDLDRWSATISYVGCCQRRAMLQLVVMLAASQQRWCYLPTTTPRWGGGCMPKATKDPFDDYERCLRRQLGVLPKAWTGATMCGWRCYHGAEPMLFLLHTFLLFATLLFSEMM